MLNQTIRTLSATMAPPAEPLVKLLDKSVRVRLKTMSVRFSDKPDFTREHHDNFLKGTVQAIVCLRRAKKANQLGLYYWYRSQEETNENFNMDNVHNGYNKLHGYLLLMKKEPELCGGMEFLDTDQPHQFESFSSFMASSLKERIVDTYFISRQDKLSLRGKQVAAPASIECPNCGYHGAIASTSPAPMPLQPMPGIFVDQNVMAQIENESTYTKTIETHTFNSKTSGVRRISQDDFARFAPPNHYSEPLPEEIEEFLFNIPNCEFYECEPIIEHAPVKAKGATGPKKVVKKTKKSGDVQSPKRKSKLKRGSLRTPRLQ